VTQDIATELKSFVTDSAKPFEQRYKKDVGEEIPKFLDARMDQVRIYHALQASKALLETIDDREAFAFQDAVLKKERSREIAYHSQRDHTCHTLNNFILGWYIYHNSAGLKDSFSDAFKKRNFGIEKSDERKFAAIWIHVSLLHDIGYIFEGDFSEPKSFANHKGVKSATDCLQNFFDKGFWTHNLLTPKDRDQLVADGLIHRYDVTAISIEQLSERLQQVGDLKLLLEEVERIFAKPVSNIDLHNAFALWSENYKFFSNEKMSRKIDKLKFDFEKLRTHGIGKGGPKILNHGVCSGLILLQSSTYYYLLYFLVESLRRENAASDLVRRYDRKTRNYSIDLWWSGLVWATAATAIHDRYQALLEDTDSEDRLSFSDDPLAFLGILVDEMQLWDRFRVFDPTKGHKLDEIPTQSSDVTLGVDNGKIRFSVPRHQIDNLEKSLDERLADWKEVVLIKATN
jgi:hypothetical protein